MKSYGLEEDCFHILFDMTSLSESDESPELESENMTFVKLLGEYKVLFEKQRTPALNKRKEAALSALTRAYNLSSGTELSMKQMLKKFNNAKTRIKKKTDTQRPGSKRVRLQNWEQLFFDLWRDKQKLDIPETRPTEKSPQPNVAFCFGEGLMPDFDSIMEDETAAYERMHLSDLQRAALICQIRASKAQERAAQAQERAAQAQERLSLRQLSSLDVQQTITNPRLSLDYTFENSYTDL